MAILPWLKAMKGKVLDLAQIEKIQHAYDLQEKSIQQLTVNNQAIQENNELVGKEVTRLEEQLKKFDAENQTLQSKLAEFQTAESARLDDVEEKILVFLGKHDGKDMHRGTLHETFNDHLSAKVNYHLNNLCAKEFASKILAVGGDDRDRYFISSAGLAYLADHGLFE